MVPPLPWTPGLDHFPSASGAFYSDAYTKPERDYHRLTQIFTEVNFVAGGPLVKTVGLGPRFNSNSCSSCHAYPAVGGSSPPSNPLFGIYQLMGATNTMPYFITTTGPVVVARFPYKSGRRDARWRRPPDVHDLKSYGHSGLHPMVQPDFTSAQQTNNIIFRQTTPTYGAGLMELIQESDIVANMNANTIAEGVSGNYRASQLQRR